MYFKKCLEMLESHCLADQVNGLIAQSKEAQGRASRDELLIKAKEVNYLAFMNAYPERPQDIKELQDQANYIRDIMEKNGHK